MKKKLVSTLALSLCFVISAGAFAGCKDPEGDKPLTEDEIYAKVVEGVNATASYTGAYTVTTVEKETEKEKAPGAEEEVYALEDAEIVSVDPAAKKLYMKSTGTETDEYTVTEVVESKLFKEGDKYYAYGKMTASTTEAGVEPQEDEMYMEYTEITANAMVKQYALSEEEYIGGFNELKVDAKIADYNAAWASYIAESKAEVVAGSTDEESDWYGCSGDGSYVVSAKEADGGYVLTIVQAMSMSNEYGTGTMSYTYIFTVKDGKLASATQKEEYSTMSYVVSDGEGGWDRATKDTQGAQQRTDNEIYETTATYAYTFAQAEYDALTTTLPAEVQTMPDRIQTKVKVVVDGIDFGKNSVYGSTVAQALQDAWNQYGIDVVWYTDAACTQAIDAETMTFAQFYELDTLYGKATAQTGYVLYTKEYVDEFAADVPAAYKTVLAWYIENSKYIYAESVSNGIWVYNSEESTYYINGVKVEFEEGQNSKVYPVEEGQTYEVKVVYTYSKTELNFFYMFGD